MFSYEIYEIFKNIYFEEHLRTTASSSSSFKLDLVDLTVFPDLNLRLTKFKDTIDPLQLFVEKRQFFSQNNQSLNNIIYH